MSGIRTEWHLAELGAEADPFAMAVYSAGLEIDLNGSEDELVGHLRTLVKREARMDATGLTCGLKDGGQDCRTCPMATLEAREERSRLCRLGKDEFRVAERLHELGDQRRANGREELSEMVTSASEWSEIGHLDSDLAELLTAVGL